MENQREFNGNCEENKANYEEKGEKKDKM